ncbi:MAG TPA: hypothetical protein VG722_08465 [Tepidisphaeraceae bacterium]|nr:hypothetical protein [Tepidisphaeraceae bacterium]
MTAIRVVFDGKAFVPQEPIALPAESEAMVLINDPTSRHELDREIREYYQSGVDADDEGWGHSSHAWDEE